MCQKLYREGKLKGINDMKVSTMHKQHIFSSIIILYCGPPKDSKRCEKIGRNIKNSFFFSN